MQQVSELGGTLLRNDSSDALPNCCYCGSSSASCLSVLLIKTSADPSCDSKVRAEKPAACSRCKSVGRECFYCSPCVLCPLLLPPSLPFVSTNDRFPSTSSPLSSISSPLLPSFQQGAPTAPLLCPQVTLWSTPQRRPRHFQAGAQRFL